MDLSDRRIVVTGAAQGLGLGIASALARYGCRLVLVDINPIVMEHAKTALFGGYAVGVVRDLGDPDAPRFIISEARRHFGSANGLVNCAGSSFYKSISETTLTDFDRLVSVNQRAPFFLSKEFAAQASPNEHDPCVVNIASVNALAGNPNLVAYAGTKGAVLAMTRSMAVEFASRIRVVAISPGAVLTQVTQELIERGVIDAPELLSRNIIRRFVSVEEIGELTAFLFSPAAASVTGANWIIDGGFTAV